MPPKYVKTIRKEILYKYATMKKLLSIGIVVTILIMLLHIPSARAQDIIIDHALWVILSNLIDEQLERKKVEEINEINKKQQPLPEFTTIKSFPSGHPTGAVSATFAWFDESFDIYIWRENGDVWMEIVPLSSYAPFICGASFLIIQNNIQYDTVMLETYAGDSQCGDIYVTSVFRLTQWSFYTDKADLDDEFTLFFDGGEYVYSLNIPASYQQNSWYFCDECSGCFIDALKGGRIAPSN